MIITTSKWFLCGFIIGLFSNTATCANNTEELVSSNPATVIDMQLLDFTQPTHRKTIAVCKTSKDTIGRSRKHNQFVLPSRTHPKEHGKLQIIQRERSEAETVLPHRFLSENTSCTDKISLMP